MHRCRRVGAVGMRLEPAAAIDENRNGTPDSNLIARAERRTNSLGPDGSVWIIELRANRIGRLKDESFEEYEVPRDNPMLGGLAVASDGVVRDAAQQQPEPTGRRQGRYFRAAPRWRTTVQHCNRCHRQCLVPGHQRLCGHVAGARARRELREPRHSDGACPILLGPL